MSDKDDLVVRIEVPEAALVFDDHPRTDGVAVNLHRSEPACFLGKIQCAGSISLVAGWQRLRGGAPGARC